MTCKGNVFNFENPKSCYFDTEILIVFNFDTRNQQEAEIPNFTKIVFSLTTQNQNVIIELQQCFGDKFQQVKQCFITTSRYERAD